MENNDLLAEMGKRIIAYRKLMNMSQEELAEKANVSPQMLSTAERGAKALRPENLLKLSSTMQVSADYLLTGDMIDKDILYLQNKLSLLSKEDLLLVENIINNCILLAQRSE